MANRRVHRRSLLQKQTFCPPPHERAASRVIDLHKLREIVGMDWAVFSKARADLEPNTQQLRKTILKRMRDKFVFHYDKDVAEQTLKTLDLNEYVFATGTGGKRKGTYYNLADEIVINYLLNDVPPDERDAVFRATLKSVGDALSAFVDCADTLMGDVLSEHTWTLQRGDTRAAIGP